MKKEHRLRHEMHIERFPKIPFFLYIMGLYNLIFLDKSPNWTYFGYQSSKIRFPKKKRKGEF